MSPNLKTRIAVKQSNIDFVKDLQNSGVFFCLFLNVLKTYNVFKE